MGNLADQNGWSNAEIGWKMANGRLLFLALNKIMYVNYTLQVMGRSTWEGGSDA